MSEELAELKARCERLALLHETGAAADAALGSPQALEAVLTAAIRATRASAGFIALINPTTGFLEIETASGLPPRAGERQLRVSEGIIGWVTRTGKAARVNNVAGDPRYVALRRLTRAELAVPLDVGGQVHGVLCVHADQRGAFS